MPAVSIALSFMGVLFLAVAAATVRLTQKRRKNQQWEDTWGEVTDYFWQDKSAAVAFLLDGKRVICSSQYLGKEILPGTKVKIRYERSRMGDYYPDSDMIRGRVLIDMGENHWSERKYLKYIAAGIFGFIGILLIVIAIAVIL